MRLVYYYSIFWHFICQWWLSKGQNATLEIFVSELLLGSLLFRYKRHHYVLISCSEKIKCRTETSQYLRVLNDNNNYIGSDLAGTSSTHQGSMFIVHRMSYLSGLFVSGGAPVQLHHGVIACKKEHGIQEEDDQVYLVALQVYVEEGDGNCVNSQLPFG